MKFKTVIYIEIYQLQHYNDSCNVALIIRGHNANRDAGLVEIFSISGALALLLELDKKNILVIDFPVAYRKQIRISDKIYKLQTLDSKTIEELSL